MVPSYKLGLDIPGGIVESDESPRAACHHEAREELGADIDVHGLLVVDWIPAHGVWGYGVMFIFDGGVLDAAPTPDTTRNGTQRSTRSSSSAWTTPTRNWDPPWRAAHVTRWMLRTTGSPTTSSSGDPVSLGTGHSFPSSDVRVGTWGYAPLSGGDCLGEPGNDLVGG